MRNTKIYSILEQFDKYEQNRCRKFLQSPYFNRDQTITHIFDLLVAAINSEKKECFEKETLWQQLNAPDDFDDVRFRKYLSDLTKLVEDFLCQQVYEKSPLDRINYLMQSVYDRKIEKLFNGIIRDSKNLIQKYPYRSANFYYYQYNIESNYYRLMEYEIKRTERSNFEELSTNLDYFYIAEKLRILLGILSRQSVSSYDYVVHFRQELLQAVKSNPTQYETIPPVSLYYQICLTYLEPEEEDHYYKLRELLEKYTHLFPVSEALNQFYASAQNYCVRKLNQGNQKFLKEYLELYKDMIRKDILVVDDVLSPWDFRNIIVVALRLGELAWAEQFISQFKDKLPSEMRDNAVSFNLAQLYFYQKNYEKVISLLQKVEYEDFTYNLNSKAMLLSAYYELQEIEPLHSLFDSFRTYLNRHKDIPASRRQSYSDLIKYTKKLTKLIPGDKQKLEKFRQELENTKNPIASQPWLLEKIAELE